MIVSEDGEMVLANIAGDISVDDIGALAAASTRRLSDTSQRKRRLLDFPHGGATDVPKFQRHSVSINSFRNGPAAAAAQR